MSGISASGPLPTGTTIELPPARIHVQQDAETVTFLIEGEIDLSNAEALGAVVHDRISRDVDQVDVDLSGVTYLDSSSLRLLTELAHRLRARRQRFVIVAPMGSMIRRLFAISGLTDTFVLADPTVP